MITYFTIVSCIVLSLGASLLDGIDPDFDEKIISLFDVVLEHNQDYMDNHGGVNYFSTLKVPFRAITSESQPMMLDHLGWALERQMSQNDLLARSIFTGEDAIDFKDGLEATNDNEFMTEVLNRMIDLLLTHPLRDVLESWPYMHCIYENVCTKETD